MSLTYLEHPHFSKSLRKLRDQGGQGKKMAEKVLSVLGGILRYEDPFSSIRKTHQGENRLKGGIKYALSDSFRLVTQQIGNNCIFVYVGSHDDTEKYLDANRGMTYLNGSDNQIIGKTFKTTSDTGQINLEPQIQEGKIWDNLSSELDQFTSDFNLSRSQLNEIADLANGSSNSVIIDTLEKIKSNLSEQNEAINEKFTILTDVLIMLNSGDKVSAKNRIFEFDKKENDILDPELNPVINLIGLSQLIPNN